MLCGRLVPFSLIVSLLCPAASVPKTAPELPEVRMKTTVVAAFKNGLGFVVKQGSGNLVDGQGRIIGVPRATLGSLWLAPADSSATLEELVAYRYPVTKYRPVNSVVELLQNSVGMTLTVNYNGKDYSGEVLGVTVEKEAPPEPQSPLRLLMGSDGGEAYRSKLLLMKTSSGVVAMNADGVTLASMSRLPELGVAESASETALRFRMKNASPSTGVNMGYLQEGLGWTPSYLVRLKDDKAAQITMQAVLVNDVEDLQDTDVYFVVGAPNFAYADRLSPMALQQALADFIKNENSGRRDMLSNAIVVSQAMAGMTESEISPSLAAAVSDLHGSPEQDMFLYNLPRITLGKGERGSYNVFTAEVAYEHVYEWEVEDRRTVDVYGNANHQYSQPASEPQIKDAVWHSLVLKNSTRYPWTSAPAMVLSGDRPVAQDALRYTPKGAPGKVKLTVATDIRTSKKEVEVERKPRAAQFYGNDYDAITVEGTLKLANYKSEPVQLRVSKQLVGTVLSAGETGNAEKTAEEIRGVNPTSRITWSVTLKPGVEKTITYQYRVYVRG